MRHHKSSDYRTVKTRRRSGRKAPVKGLRRSDAPFLAGLIVWLILLGSFALLNYALLVTIVGSAIGGVGIGFGIATWQKGQQRLRADNGYDKTSRRHSSDRRQTFDRGHTSKSSLRKLKRLDDTDEAYLSQYPLLEDYAITRSSRSIKFSRSSRKRQPLTIKDWLERYGR